MYYIKGHLHGRVFIKDNTIFNAHVILELFFRLKVVSDTFLLVCNLVSKHILVIKFGQFM